MSLRTYTIHTYIRTHIDIDISLMCTSMCVFNILLSHFTIVVHYDCDDQEPGMKLIVPISPGNFDELSQITIE